LFLKTKKSLNIKMGKNIVALIFSFVVNTFADVVYLQVPTNIKLATYAIGKYNHRGLVDIPRSTIEKNRFVNSITRAIQSKYPNTSIKHVVDRENEMATSSSFQNEDFIEQADFVFFEGHGSQQRLVFSDAELPLTPDKIQFGGNTKWVILEACLVLNVNRRDSISGTIENPNNIHQSRLSDLRGLFNGVHAILGHYAQTYQWQIKPSWYSMAFRQTDDKFEYFAQNFIIGGMGIWDAYSLAVRRMYNNFEELRFMGFKSNIKGLKPAIVYFKKTYPNGEVLDMSQETFANTYNAPIMPTTGSTSSILIKTLTLGEPQYY